LAGFGGGHAEGKSGRRQKFPNGNVIVSASFSAPSDGAKPKANNDSRAD